MAYTEHYVDAAAAGGGDGSTTATSGANGAWTFAEAIAQTLGAGHRMNVKGNITTGAVTFTAGTVVARSLWRWYNATPGDLDDRLAWNSDGTWNNTNVPTLTITGTVVPAAFVTLQNVDASGSVNAALIGSASVDHFGLVKSRFINTANNASARCVQLDDAAMLQGCYFGCTGASHASPIVDTDAGTYADNCAFVTTAAGGHISLDYGMVIACRFSGNAASPAITFNLASTSASQHIVRDCTGYAIGIAITLPNAASAASAIIVNNHFTDCVEWVNSAYSATANTSTIEVNNRTRDISGTYRTGIEPVVVREITTDTGGASTDYVNAGAGDLTLIDTAAGYGTGNVRNRDIGAFQNAATGGTTQYTTITEDSGMLIPQNNTTVVLTFDLVDSDGVGVTGLTPTVTLSKNGGAYASPAGAVTEVSGGTYKVAANATDANTLGSLKLKATGTGAVPKFKEWRVVEEIDVGESVLAAVPTLPVAVPVVGTSDFGTLLGWMGLRSVHKFTQTDSLAAIRNAADSGNLFTAPASDDDTTFLVGPWS